MIGMNPGWQSALLIQKRLMFASDLYETSLSRRNLASIPMLGTRDVV